MEIEFYIPTSDRTQSRIEMLERIFTKYQEKNIDSDLAFTYTRGVKIKEFTNIENSKIEITIKNNPHHKLIYFVTEDDSIMKDEHFRPFIDVELVSEPIHALNAQQVNLNQQFLDFLGKIEGELETNFSTGIHTHIEVTSVPIQKILAASDVSRDGSLFYQIEEIYNQRQFELMLAQLENVLIELQNPSLAFSLDGLRNTFFRNPKRKQSKSVTPFHSQRFKNFLFTLKHLREKNFINIETINKMFQRDHKHIPIELSYRQYEINFASLFKYGTLEIRLFDSFLDSDYLRAIAHIARYFALKAKNPAYNIDNDLIVSSSEFRRLLESVSTQNFLNARTRAQKTQKDCLITTLEELSDF